MVTLYGTPVELHKQHPLTARQEKSRTDSEFKNKWHRQLVRARLDLLAAMEFDNSGPGIRVQKIPAQNLVVRLFHREIHRKPRQHEHSNRYFYQNITPNFTVTNVQKPPCFLRKFSPDGRFLIAFSSDQTSIEIYRYMGPSAAADLLHWCEGTSVLKETEQKTFEIRRNIFDRFFKLTHTVNVATNCEQLNRECSLFTDNGKYVYVFETKSYVLEDICLLRDEISPCSWRFTNCLLGCIKRFTFEGVPQKSLELVICNLKQLQIEEYYTVYNWDQK
nr:DET1 homolog [Penaeus vannamei]